MHKRIISNAFKKSGWSETSLPGLKMVAAATFTVVALLLVAFAPLCAHGESLSSSSPCLELLRKSNLPKDLPSATLDTHKYALFSNGHHPVDNYNSIVQNGFVTGDILTFSDGQSFEFIRPLGNGFTTNVLAAYILPPDANLGEITDADRMHFPMVALRIPIADKTLKNINVHVSEYINSFLDGYEALRSQNMAVPAIYRALESEYVAVEYIEFDFNGNDFFKRPHTIDPVVLAQAEAALFEFARTTAELEDIGDFNAGQMAYSTQEQKWYLLDWTSQHKFHIVSSRDDQSGRPLPLLENKRRRRAKQKLPSQESLTVFNDRFTRSLSYRNDNRIADGNRELSPREHDLISRLNEAIYVERRSPVDTIRATLNTFLDFLGWRDRAPLLSPPQPAAE